MTSRRHLIGDRRKPYTAALLTLTFTLRVWTSRLL
ncbi:hypothetical protein C8E86_5607 [Catellatospora citrea]|nr:hypothetical protein C8E86_5607 [Catellatospora citrea]